MLLHLNGMEMENSFDLKHLLDKLGWFYEFYLYTIVDFVLLAQWNLGFRFSLKLDALEH